MSRAIGILSGIGIDIFKTSGTSFSRISKSDFIMALGDDRLSDGYILLYFINYFKRRSECDFQL